VTTWPAALQEMYDDGVEFMAGSIQQGTLRKYRAEMEKFQEWREKAGFGRGLPAPKEHVLAYVPSLVKARGATAASGALAAIIKMHALVLKPMPYAAEVKALKKALARTVSRSRQPDLVDDVKPAMVVAFYEDWKAGRLEGYDALWARTFVTGACIFVRCNKRAGDAKACNVEHVRVGPDGGVSLTFVNIKLYSGPMTVPIDALPAGVDGPCPARLLVEHVAARRAQGAKDGDALFVSKKGLRVDSHFWTRAAQAVARAAERHGIVSPGGKWSSKSFRAGSSTTMATLGYGEVEVRALSGHKSEALNNYLRRGGIAEKGLSTQMFGRK
jgi:hypothetical protein